MSSAITLHTYTRNDVGMMCEIWNEVVRSGNAFPQETELSQGEAASFFSSQTHCGVAELDERLAGMYILHPNRIGRCSHLANASYAVAGWARGRGVGEKLVRDSLEEGRQAGFRVLQFNAVVASNRAAIALYEKLGFVHCGRVPGGFRHDDMSFEDIEMFWHKL